MSYFQQLYDLPVHELYTELKKLIHQKKLSWENTSQICINTLPTHPDDYLIGSGSLELDWNNKQTIINDDGTQQTHVPRLQNPRQESDFNTLCSVFKDTLFEDVYKNLDRKYNIGRIRLMKMKPKTCLSWHIDLCARVHFPIKTQDGCIMVIENEVMHMAAGTWWYTNTHNKHTAVNASNQDRIPLVCSVTG